MLFFIVVGNNGNQPSPQLDSFTFSVKYLSISNISQNTKTLAKWL